MLVPPDGGWGWVIVAASFMCNVVVDGIMFSFGTFKTHIISDFAIPDAQYGLVSSLQTGSYLLIGKILNFNCKINLSSY